MILYKYLSLARAISILDTSEIGFSRCDEFNDPFDVPAYPPEDSDTVGADVMSSLHLMMKNVIWIENTGILSLTRTPRNALMWAHYADSHEGIVIGIDVVRAGFTSESDNLIPAQFGSVIYVSQRPTSNFVSRAETPLAVGATHHFPRDHYEKLQRLFLHKSLHWAYEEEVRVLKCLKERSEGIAPAFRSTEVEGKKRNLWPLPEGAIKEVYFGFRSGDGADEIAASLRANMPDVKLLQSYLDADNLSVGTRDFTFLGEE